MIQETTLSTFTMKNGEKFNIYFSKGYLSITVTDINDSEKTIRVKGSKEELLKFSKEILKSIDNFSGI